MRTSVKLVASATLSLALAGTCLAAPAFAASGTSALGGLIDAAAQTAAQAQDQGQDAADATDTAAADEAASQGETVTFAGLSFTLPEGFAQLDDTDEQVLIAANEAQTCMVSVYDMRDAALPEGADWDDYFAELAQGSVEGLESTVKDLGTDTSKGGVQLHGFSVETSDDEGTYFIVQAYAPMGEGFVFIQAGYDTANTSKEESQALGDFLDSVSVASESGVKTSACGLTFELPEGMSAYKGDENAWMDEGSDILIKAVDHVANGASHLTDDDYGALFNELMPSGDSADSKVTLLDLNTVAGKDVTSTYATYEVVDPDGTMYAVVIVTPAADDSLSVFIVWCTEDGAQKYGEAITTMMESFEQE